MKVKIVNGIQQNIYNANDIKYLPRTGDKLQTYYPITGSPARICLVKDVMFDFVKDEITILVI